MKQIVLVRIDERLLHGQVMTGWLKVNRADTILIIDDESAKNQFTKRLLMAVAPKDMKVLIEDFPSALSYLSDPNGDDRILILVKTPNVILNLLKNSVKIDEVILGNMSASSNRKRLNKNVSVSEQEKEDLKAIIGLNCKVYCQMVITDKKEDVEKLL
ncbi:MAG: PTS system mannose/fructose/N-acetylgalactosamine-transporter subunit IIB [Erysipelotrichaceae bacterium]